MPEDCPSAADVIEGGRSTCAMRPGLRNVFAPTSRPRRARVVTFAHAARVGVSLEDRLVRLAEDGVEVVPRPERLVPELVDASRGGLEGWPLGCLAPEQDAEPGVGHRGASPRSPERASAQSPPRRRTRPRRSSPRPSATSELKSAPTLAPRWMRWMASPMSGATESTVMRSSSKPSGSGIVSVTITSRRPLAAIRSSAGGEKTAWLAHE